MTDLTTHKKKNAKTISTFRKQVPGGITYSEKQFFASYSMILVILSICKCVHWFLRMFPPIFVLRKYTYTFCIMR